MTIRENKPPNPERPQPRFAPGPLGRGVYLADLVRWLMEKHEATRVHVVKEYLCPVMLEKQPLFGDVKRSGDATPISDGAEWSMTGSGYVEKVSPKSGPSLRTVRTGANRFRVEHVTVNTDSIGKGVDAAVKWLLDRWGFDRNVDAIMDIDTRASWLAVSEADARRCWGWRGADEAAPAVDAVAKADDGPQGATNDAWWHAWCAERKAQNTKPDGTLSRSNEGRAKWTNDALMVLHMRHSHLMSACGMSFAAAKTAIAKDIGRSHQSLIVPLEKAAALVAEANNKPEQQVA